jgi:hypothetical protein
MIVARSSMELKYVNLSTGIQEAVWLSRLLTKLGLITVASRTLPLGYTSPQIIVDISTP